MYEKENSREREEYKGWWPFLLLSLVFNSNWDGIFGQAETTFQKSWIDHCTAVLLCVNAY